MHDQMTTFWKSYSNRKLLLQNPSSATEPASHEGSAQRADVSVHLLGITFPCI